MPLSPAAPRKKLAAIMSALNEEANLAAALDDALGAMERLGIDGEILLFDDGSTDGTGAVADRYAALHPNVRVFRHETPQGIGGCFWEGIRLTEAEVIVWIPGDGENDCGDIFRYLPLMDHVDVVVPFIYNREVRSPARQLLSKVYKGIINVSFGLLLNYMNGTVMYRRSILLDLELENRGFFYQTELLIKTIRRGYLYAEVPQALGVRVGGTSKAVSLRSLRAVVKGYAGTMASFHVLDRHGGDIVRDSVTWARRRALAGDRGHS